MKLKSFCLLLFLCLTGQLAWADDYFLQRKQSRLVERETVFHEGEWTLPELPNPQKGDWLDLDVDARFSGKPQVLLSSITTAEDGSIRYLFNNRSAVHHDNITAEAILCINDTSSFSSDGARWKIFGFADDVNQRWIKPRKSDWQVFGGANNSNNYARNALFRAFCLETRAKNDEELRLRVFNVNTSRAPMGGHY